jgi:ubiquinone/menaquinone biosynthesis C-methylase UbiE
MAKPTHDVASDYASRQLEMEAWYRSLIGSGTDQTERAFLTDYAPHAAYLGTLSGRVIDIGGGAGVAARYLAPDVDYVVVEPAEFWHSDEWATFSRNFRQSGPEPRFVDASGEALPFGDGEFDAALSMWALNHVRDPESCIEEMVRVLKPGGRALVVVEDVPPNWPDLLVDATRRVMARLARVHFQAGIPWPLVTAFKSKLAGKWPIQLDHLFLVEADLVRSFEQGMQVRSRRWLASSLTYELVKP